MKVGQNGAFVALARTLFLYTEKSSKEEYSHWNKLHEVLSKTFLDKAVISSAARAAGEPLLFFPRFLSAMVT